MVQATCCWPVVFPLDYATDWPIIRADAKSSSAHERSDAPPDRLESAPNIVRVFRS